MSGFDAVLSELRKAASSPRAQLEGYLSQGRKAIGCMPYFCPEELVHAAGMIPFGLWGAETRVSEAERYLPAFICSIVQTTLELGIRGEYNGLSAVMIPISCDSLKSMDANWRYGVKDIPMIPVAHAQNRKISVGVEFTASQYRKIKAQLEELSGKTVADADIVASIRVYNKRNAAMRGFMAELSKRPGAMKPSERNAVFKSSYFMEAGEFTDKVLALTAALAAMPEGGEAGPRLVTSGIIADSTALLRILDECGVTIIDDAVTHESLRFRYDTEETGDPFAALARQIGDIEGCPVLFDRGKKRGDMLVELVRRNSADGVLFVMTKFCDPEEYDIVPLRRILDREGIRSLTVEVDQQTEVMEQARTAVETFCELLG